jgi:serine protease Do
MRFSRAWGIILAGLVWGIGGLIVDIDKTPRNRGPSGSGGPAVLEPGPLPRAPAPTAPGSGRQLADISDFDPEIRVQGHGGRTNSVGTAFAVSTGGAWLTARHVVEDCDKVGILTDPNRRKGFRVTDITIHPRADIALMRSDKRRVPPIEIRPFADKLAVGQTSFFHGYPAGEPGDAIGRLLGRAKLRKVGLGGFVEPGIAWAVVKLQPRLDSLGGMSGGPVLDEEGKVLGIAVAANLRRGRVLTSPPVTIHRTLDSAGVRPDGTPSAGLSNAALNTRDYPTHGDALRRQLSVAKVVCLVK